jgi:hypothetical protein
LDPFPFPDALRCGQEAISRIRRFEPSRDVLLAGAPAGSIAAYEYRRAASPHHHKGAL